MSRLGRVCRPTGGLDPGPDSHPDPGRCDHREQSITPAGRAVRALENKVTHARGSRRGWHVACTAPGNDEPGGCRVRFCTSKTNCHRRRLRGSIDDRRRRRRAIRRGRGGRHRADERRAGARVHARSDPGAGGDVARRWPACRRAVPDGRGAGRNAGGERNRSRGAGRPGSRSRSTRRRDIQAAEDPAVQANYQRVAAATLEARQTVVKSANCPDLLAERR